MMQQRQRRVACIVRWGQWQVQRTLQVEAIRGGGGRTMHRGGCAHAAGLRLVLLLVLMLLQMQLQFGSQQLLLVLWMLLKLLQLLQLLMVVLVLVCCLLLLVFELFVFVGFELMLCAGGQQCLQRAALRLLLLSAGLGLTVLEHIIAGRAIEAMPIAVPMTIPMPIGSSSVC